MTKTKKALTSKEAKMDDINTKIEKATAMSANLDSSDTASTKMRQKEHNEWVAIKKDLEQAQSATATAVKVLKDYYSGKSFLQQQPGDSTSMSSLMQESSESSQPA